MKILIATLLVSAFSFPAFSNPLRADFVYDCLETKTLWVKVISYDDNGTVSVSNWQEVSKFKSENRCNHLANQFNSKK